MAAQVYRFSRNRGRGRCVDTPRDPVLAEAIQQLKQLRVLEPHSVDVFLQLFTKRIARFQGRVSR
jgi:hypothetical protein